jgi:hypothetical protein
MWALEVSSGSTSCNMQNIGQKMVIIEQRACVGGISNSELAYELYCSNETLKRHPYEIICSADYLQVLQRDCKCCALTFYHNT